MGNSGASSGKAPELSGACIEAVAFKPTALLVWWVIYMWVGLPFEQAEVFVNLTTYIGAKVIPPLTYT